MAKEKSMTYADAGVDLEKAEKIINPIRRIAEKTWVPGVIGEIGGFGGLFSLDQAGAGKGTLVSSTDGVGTKLKIAFMTGVHNTVGIDLVAMCVNDILVQGAKPLFFLDYLATGKIESRIHKGIISGVAKGCLQAGCALIGGETAEMPGLYQAGEYDLAGFAVGIILPGQEIEGKAKVGDQLIGIPSSGLHSNGYSLVRKICFEKLNLKTDDFISEFGQILGRELLAPTRIYSNIILSLLEKGVKINGAAHITGGGIPGNLVRILPKNVRAELWNGSWDIPPIFDFLQKHGPVSKKEMRKTFNNGLGLILSIPENEGARVSHILSSLKEDYFRIGEIQKRKGVKNQVQWR